MRLAQNEAAGVLQGPAALFRLSEVLVALATIVATALHATALESGGPSRTGTSPRGRASRRVLSHR